MSRPKKNNYRGKFYNKNNTLVSIFRHTVDHCKKQKFILGQVVKYDSCAEEFVDENILATVKPFEFPPVILVDNIDSFDMAIKIGSTDTPILVLNLASETTSGGGVKRGARAQEEDLYRKSNYYEANNQNLYPMSYTQVIYSPIVNIIKNSKYQLLEKSFVVSCLAVAAIRKPLLATLANGNTTYANTSDQIIMQEKINMIFKTAIKHGHTDLVLGALGCGVYGNPNKEVANMFKKSIDIYGKYFRRIGFAVLSSENNTNYEVFRNIIYSK